jgi:NTP pyrophosphatase (non-canonical NTP hydrolase)
MPQTDPHMQIARKIRSVETAKIELVQQVSEVFRSIQSGNERELAESLGGLVAIAYFMGHQLGVDLSAIDREARKGLPRTLGHETIHPTDYDFVQRHLGSSR